ncbi:hypothetical protein PPTG_03787 [Phytophthora nicotianae INRA-310]|uniref:Uncharacterized protein n=2 Tax=Phytophthora nicotianae TaxID=4792 RepID=W2QY69_PHYN3|nr:hypothetical protein PPTG_03787 [Phytophthora nicotianae INRA-310]ETN18073.1 hypothetical protein PPTG_03787 [Phytophthora nicotianae INRA-310]
MYAKELESSNGKVISDKVTVDKSVVANLAETLVHRPTIKAEEPVAEDDRQWNKAVGHDTSHDPRSRCANSERTANDHLSPMERSRCSYRRSREPSRDQRPRWRSAINLTMND